MKTYRVMQYTCDGYGVGGAYVKAKNSSSAIEEYKRSFMLVRAFGDAFEAAATDAEGTKDEILAVILVTPTSENGTIWFTTNNAYSALAYRKQLQDYFHWLWYGKRRDWSVRVVRYRAERTAE